MSVFPSLFGQDDEKLRQMKQAAIAQNLNAAGYDDFAAADAAQLAASGYGEGAIAQNLGAAGVAQDPEFLAADAAGLNETVGQNMPKNDFDLAGLAKSLNAAGSSTFKFDKPDMTLMRGNGKAPVMPLEPQPAQQAQPLSTAMGAIGLANQLYGAPQQQMPQQQQQPNMMRRMLGLA